MLAAWLGIINALDNPTRQTFAVELVGRDTLVNAVALNSMQFNAARIIGPAMAGLLIAKLGIAPAIFVNALSYVAAIAGLLMMDRRRFIVSTAPKRNGVLRPLLEGLSYCVRTPQVLLILIVVASIGTFGYNFSVVLPLLAGFVLHTKADGFGALSAFLGLGSLIAAFATAFARHVTVTRLLIGSAAFALILGAVAISPVFGIAAGLVGTARFRRNHLLDYGQHAAATDGAGRATWARNEPVLSVVRGQHADRLVLDRDAFKLYRRV